MNQANQALPLPKTLADAIAHLQIVDFDPKVPAHVEAFVWLTQKGRQHPTMRFHLEQPYLDVITMMYDKIGREYAAKVLDAAAKKTSRRAGVVQAING